MGKENIQSLQTTFKPPHYIYLLKSDSWTFCFVSKTMDTIFLNVDLFVELQCNTS